MSHWRLFYHVVWSTRGREPLLDATLARVVERSLRATGHEHGAVVHAIGIMPDHVHLAVSIPPRIAVAAFIKQLNGSANHLINHALPEDGRPTFAWQAEYGVFSFGEKALPEVIAYVENQPARHAAGRLWPSLERDGSIAESSHTAPSPDGRDQDRSQPRRGFVG